MCKSAIQSGGCIGNTLQHTSAEPPDKVPAIRPHACADKILRYVCDELPDDEAEVFESQLFHDEYLASVVEEILHAAIRFRLTKREIHELLQSNTATPINLNPLVELSVPIESYGKFHEAPSLLNT